MSLPPSSFFSLSVCLTVLLPFYFILQQPVTRSIAWTRGGEGVRERERDRQRNRNRNSLPYDNWLLPLIQALSLLPSVRLCALFKAS